jgi:plasmid stability protein
MTLTLDNLPPGVEDELRRRAEAEGKSLDQVVADVLARGLDLPPQPIKYRDLSDIAGTWVDDPVFDEIRREHDQVDPDPSE